MAPIYLDNHATTRCDPRVVEAMLPYFTEIYGNPASRSHGFGLQARAAVEKARARIAAAIGASPKEIVFTSGATESNNLALLGIARARGRGHLVTTAIEHKAVLDPIAHLERQGFSVTRVPVDATGVVDARAVIDALRDDTILVSVMAANNEIGTLQPVAEIGAACRDRGIVLHTDAAQAVGRIPIDVAAWRVDLLSVSAHKLYGPKGIGALYVRRGRPWLKLAPLLHGGGHERGYRPGTLPVPAIVGFGVACDLCREELDAGALDAVARLRDRLWEGLSALGGVHLNGDPDRRLPNNLSVSFDGVEARTLMMALRDIALSSGSACTSASLEPSHVLRALGLPPDRAHNAIRLGLGRFTTEAEIEHTIARFAEVVPELRAMNPLLDVPTGSGDP